MLKRLFVARGLAVSTVAAFLLAAAVGLLLSVVRANAQPVAPWTLQVTTKVGKQRVSLASIPLTDASGRPLAGSDKRILSRFGAWNRCDVFEKGRWFALWSAGFEVSFHELRNDLGCKKSTLGQADYVKVWRKETLVRTDLGLFRIGQRYRTIPAALRRKATKAKAIDETIYWLPSQNPCDPQKALAGNLSHILEIHVGDFGARPITAVGSTISTGPKPCTGE